MITTMSFNVCLLIILCIFLLATIIVGGVAFLAIYLSDYKGSRSKTMAVVLSVVLLVGVSITAIPVIVKSGVAVMVQDYSEKFVDEFIMEKEYYEIIYNSGALDTFSKKAEYNEEVEPVNSELEKALKLKPELFIENMDSRIYDLEPIKTFE